MKTEYKQRFRADILSPTLEAIETSEAPAQYFYNGAAISEAEFTARHAEIKKENGLQSKTITRYNDSDEKIAEVSFYDGDNRTSLNATIQEGDQTFEYQQIKQKTGRLYAEGQYATSYMRISYGNQESSYIDRQPDLDDPLLTVRDEFIAQYMDILSGSAPVYQTVKAADNAPPAQ